MSLDAHVAMSYRYNGSGRERNSILCLRNCTACCYAYDSPLALKQAEAAKSASRIGGHRRKPDRFVPACLSIFVKDPGSSALIQHQISSPRCSSEAGVQKGLGLDRAHVNA